VQAREELTQGCEEAVRSREEVARRDVRKLRMCLRGCLFIPFYHFFH
jgi:hypothetical protein